ncbi:MAG: 2OG-Fe(II) oxygenase [Kangiellaceae bacterium]|jgi:prolyl 4-hydroxylase|nr:2OG-Fe(II) oxygenase [Kangiellaceae bacterium]
MSVETQQLIIGLLESADRQQAELEFGQANWSDNELFSLLDKLFSKIDSPSDYFFVIEEAISRGFHPILAKVLINFRANNCALYCKLAESLIKANYPLPDALLLHTVLIIVMAKGKSYFDSKNHIQRPAIKQICQHLNHSSEHKDSSVTSLSDDFLCQTQGSVISLADCDIIIRAFAHIVQPSVIHNPTTGQSEPHPFRTSYGASFSEMPPLLLLSFIEVYIAEKLHLDLNEMESPQLLKYDINQEYKAHYDFLSDEALALQKMPGNQRVKTHIIYLNDNYDGGETEFNKLNISVKGKAGDLLSFANSNKSDKIITESLHSSRPIKQGTKWVLVTWQRQRAWRYW